MLRYVCFRHLRAIVDVFFFSSRRRHTRYIGDWSSDVCSSDLGDVRAQLPTVVPAPPANCQLRTNSNPFIHGQRALLAALRDWIIHGTEPPPSLYPTLDAGTLVPLPAIHYPYIPAVNWTLAGVTTQKFYLDRGPLLNVDDIAD